MVCKSRHISDILLKCNTSQISSSSLVVFSDLNGFLSAFLYLRCSLREKEFICRDKDMEIQDLKQKIVSLIRSLEQLKKQRDGLDHQLRLLVSMFGLSPHLKIKH